jgi:hypothetical protein
MKRRRAHAEVLWIPADLVQGRQAIKNIKTVSSSPLAMIGRYIAET